MVYHRTQYQGRCIGDRSLTYQPPLEPANTPGVLVFLVAGRFPTLDPNDALWIRE
jgi:hypothetical protein